MILCYNLQLVKELYIKSGDDFFISVSDFKLGLKGSIVGFEFDKRILNCHDVSRTVKGYFSLT